MNSEQERAVLLQLTRLAIAARSGPDVAAAFATRADPEIARALAALDEPRTPR